MKIDLTQTHDVLGAYQATDFSNVKKEYQDAGTKYCFDVLDGKYITGYQIKLACFRHLRDLQRQDTKDFPYHYDISEVQNILKFASVCPEIKTRKPVKLMGWQQFVLAMLVGWRDSKGDKRFTRAILSVARHNGKTYLMSIVTIYSFLIEAINEAGQDFLVSSINYKQTSKLMGYIKQMLLYLMEVPPFGQLVLELGINPKTLSSQSDQIVMSKTGSRLLAVTYKSGQYDSSTSKLQLAMNLRIRKWEIIVKSQRLLPDSSMLLISNLFKFRLPMIIHQYHFIMMKNEFKI